MHIEQRGSNIIEVFGFLVDVSNKFFAEIVPGSHTNIWSISNLFYSFFKLVAVVVHCSQIMELGLSSYNYIYLEISGFQEKHLRRSWSS